MLIREHEIVLIVRLSQVLDALGESVPCASYDSWMVYVPEGQFLSRIGPTEFYKVIYILIRATGTWQHVHVQQEVVSVVIGMFII